MTDIVDPFKITRPTPDAGGIVDPFKSAAAPDAAAAFDASRAPTLTRPTGYSVTDIPKETIGSAVKGVASVAGGIGDLGRMIARPIVSGVNAAAGNPYLLSEPTNAFAAPAGFVSGLGDKLINTESAAAKAEKEKQIVTGDITSPSTLGLGEGASSPMAIALATSGLIGQAAPLLLGGLESGAARLAPEIAEALPSIAAKIAGKQALSGTEAAIANTAAAAQKVATRRALATGAGIGGLQGAEGASEGERTRIEQMDAAELANVPGYQQRLAQGMAPDAARADLAKEAGDSAFSSTLPIATAAGLVSTAPLLEASQGVLSRIAGKSVVARAAAGAALEAPTQAAIGVGQAAAETAGANAATGEDRSLTENSAAAAGAGAALGGGFGAFGAVAHRLPHPDAAPGSLSDAANAIHEATGGKPADFVGDVAGNVQDTRTPDTGIPVPEQKQTPAAAPVQNVPDGTVLPSGDAAGARAAEAPAPAGSLTEAAQTVEPNAVPQPPNVPWFDQASGEMRQPTNEEIKDEFHKRFANLDTPSKLPASADLAAEWGVPKSTLITLRKEAIAERNDGITPENRATKAIDDQTAQRAADDAELAKLDANTAAPSETAATTTEAQTNENPAGSGVDAVRSVGKAAPTGADVTGEAGNAPSAPLADAVKPNTTEIRAAAIKRLEDRAASGSMTKAERAELGNLKRAQDAAPVETAKPAEQTPVDEKSTQPTAPDVAKPSVPDAGTVRPDEANAVHRQPMDAGGDGANSGDASAADGIQPTRAEKLRGADGSAVGGAGRAAVEGAPEAATGVGRSAVVRADGAEPATAPGHPVEPAVVTKTPPEGGVSASKVDPSRDILETDITPPSGGAFENRHAAEIQAKRHAGGEVVPVDGGFVVRTPKAEEATAASDAVAAAPKTVSTPEKSSAVAPEATKPAAPESAAIAKPTPVADAISAIAGGMHPEKALTGATPETIRAVATAMGRKFSPKATHTAIVGRLGEEARSEWMARAKKATAVEATADPTAAQKQQARDPEQVSNELESRVAKQAPQIDALSNDEARAALAAIGETKPKDLRDPHATLSRQHPDDVDTGLAAAAKLRESSDAAIPEGQSRKFYVTMVRDGRVARLAGPFESKTEADAARPRAQAEAEKADPRSVFDGFGVTAVTAAEHKPGVLNERLGLAAHESLIAAAARESAAHPEAEKPATPAQQEAGNHKMGHVDVHGLDVTIEVPKGGLRKGTTKDGKPWERAASDHYGYIKRTEAADGEQVDVYLGPHAEKPDAKVFVIDQVKPGTKVYDESKAMVGYATGRDARKSYDANFPKGMKVFGGIKEMSLDEFKTWVKDGSAKKPASDAVQVRAEPLPKQVKGERRTKQQLAETVQQRIDAGKNGKTGVDMTTEKTMRLYHGGGADLNEVREGGSFNRFDGVFASQNRESANGHGQHLYTLDVPESKVLRQRALDFDIDPETVSASLRKAMPRLRDADFDTAWKAVVEDRSESVDPDALMRVFGEETVGEASWDAQRVRGRLAKELGYQAVEMTDEHGTSFLVLPGIKPKPESSPDDSRRAPPSEGRGVSGVVESAKPATGKESVLVEPKATSANRELARSNGVPKEAGETLARYRNDQPLKADPNYKAAKSGDSAAAAKLVERQAAPLVEEAKQRFGKDVIYVAPHAEEATGQNKIPNALAHFIAARAGGRVDDGIVQTNRAFHTGADPMERMLSRSTFDGPVEKGARYVLVDDATTMGGTFADLAHHIQANGGEVAGTMSLVNAARSGKIHPDAKLTRQLEGRFGDEIRKQFGVDPAALTAEEAKYLIGFRTADELRNRAASAGQERVRRLLSKGIRLESAAKDAAPNAPLDEGRSVSGDGAFRHGAGEDLPTAGDPHTETIDKDLRESTSALGNNAPTLRVLSSAEQLPERAKADPRYQRAHGFYDEKTGTVYVVAPNNATARDARVTYAHEAIGHFGMDQIVDQHVKGGWDSLVTAVDRLRNDPSLTSPKMRDVLESVERRYRKDDGTRANPKTFAKEFFAVTAERGIKNGLLDRVVAAVRAFLRKLYPDMKWSEGDIHGLLRQSEKYIRSDDSVKAQNQADVRALAFAKTGDPFYSALNESVEQAKGMPRKADGAAWKQWMDGAQRRGEFKQAEREWMGVDQFLDSHKGPLTREQVQDFVRQNQVKLTESTFAENHFDTLTEPGPLESNGPSKFGRYTLPGGENYREMLLTLPPTKAEPRPFEIRKEGDQFRVYRQGDDHWSSQHASEAAARGRAESDQYRDDRTASINNDYQSRHFDEPNILAHVRVNDRVGQNGEKILHIEEIQSDWHQSGRKQGYRPSEADIAVAEKLVDDRNGSPDKILAAEKLLRDARYIGAEGMVPDAPFKKEWPLLAFKRALRMAVEKGYDKVTWTTGKQQADRFDLSKQVRSIEWSGSRDGSKTVTISPHAGNDIEFKVNPDGATASISGGSSGNEFTGKRLDEVVGKDHADKIMADRDGSLSGDGLKVGGEGMKAFYDKMLPNEIGKYVKQWGAKVGTTDVQVDKTFRKSAPPLIGRDEVPVMGAVHSIDITPAMVESVRGGQPLFDMRDPNTAGLTEAQQKNPTDVAAAQRAWREQGTESPYFKRFFDGSKVVDKAGEATPVFHGTGEEFTVFDSLKAGESTEHSTSPLGHFFTENRKLAERYAENASDGRPADARVIDAYLGIKKPYEMSVDEAHNIDTPQEARALQAKLRQQGYDGIHIAEAKSWVAFDSAQIKSAENRGTFDPAHKDINFSLPEASMETMDHVAKNPDESAWERVKATVAGKARDLTPKALDAIQLSHLVELMEQHPAQKAIRSYDDARKQMSADRSALMVGAPDAAEHPNDMLRRGAANLGEDLQKLTFQKGVGGWFGKRRPEAKALIDVMHASTDQGIDPSKPYSKLFLTDSRGAPLEWTKANARVRIKELRAQMRSIPGGDKSALIDKVKFIRNMENRERVRAQAYPDLVAKYQALPEAYKKSFQQQRDWHTQMRDELEKAHIEKIKLMGLDSKYERQMVEMIHQKFAENKVEGIYFPLSRDGDHFIAYTDKQGEQGYEMFESSAAAERREKELRGSGAKIYTQGLRDNNLRAKDAPSGTFVGDMINIARKGGAPEKVLDQMYQEYLKTLPEMSMRKHNIHRKKIQGYTDDGLRTFAKVAFHGAHQLAKLRHSPKMEAALEAIELSTKNYGMSQADGESSTTSHRDVATGDMYLANLKKRHDYIMAPKDTQLANTANAIGFTYFLGASPASALTNLTQVAQITLPVLGAQHGFGKASKALAYAWQQSAKTGGNIARTLTSDVERQAYRVLDSRGDFQRTRSHDLAGLSEGSLLKTNPAWSKTMTAISYMFHKAEVVNRESTAMAAFRLDYAKNKDFNKAVQYASDMTNGTQFDYSAENRPPLMQGNTMRIATQFKNYSLAMTWMMGRNLHQAMKGETPEVRRQALRTFAGIMGTTAIMAGTMGLPMINAVKLAANAGHALFGDDEPWDFNTEYRAWLQEHLGENAGKWVADGAVNQITGATLSSRVGLANLWSQDADRELEGADAYHSLLETLAGPMGGLAKNFYVGSKYVGDGNVQRGIETMMPTFAKNAMKALRFSQDGANSLRGDPILPDIGPGEDLVQALGFTPTRLFEQQKTNSALKNYEQSILDRRASLINAYAMAVHADGDRDLAMQKIHAFNTQYPEIALKSQSIRQSLNARARYSAEAQNGVFVNKKLGPRLRDQVGVSP